MNDTNHDLLLKKNLEEVFNERDPDRRTQAIKALYAEDAVFYEDEDKFEGWSAISNRFNAILAPTPAAFTFSVTKPPGRIADLEQLTWQLGPAGAQSVASGLDVALIRNGRIQSLYTFIDAESQRDKRTER